MPRSVRCRIRGNCLHGIARPSLVQAPRPGARRSGPGRAGDCERETQGVRRERSGDRRAALELEARRSALRRRNRDDRSPHRRGLLASLPRSGPPRAQGRRSPALMAQVRQPAKGRSISRLEARLASDQRHAQLRLCGRSGAAGASFDGGRLRPADRVSPQRQTRAQLARLGRDRAAAPLNRRAGVQVHRAASSSGRTFLKPVGTRTGSIARSSPSFCGFRCCRGNGTRTRRDGWRGRLQTPSNNV